MTLRVRLAEPLRVGIGEFVVITAPVSAITLMRAAISRSRAAAGDK